MKLTFRGLGFCGLFLTEISEFRWKISLSFRFSLNPAESCKSIHDVFFEKRHKMDKLKARFLGKRKFKTHLPKSIRFNTFSPFTPKTLLMSCKTLIYGKFVAFATWKDKTHGLEQNASCQNACNLISINFRLLIRRKQSLDHVICCCTLQRTQK